MAGEFSGLISLTIILVNSGTLSLPGSFRMKGWGKASTVYFRVTISAGVYPQPGE
jgi:hypothetical protein